MCYPGVGSSVGVSVGVAPICVGVAPTVTVGVMIMIGVGATLVRGVALAEGDAVGVSVGVPVAVAVAVGIAVFVALGVVVAVGGTSVGLTVAVGLGGVVSAGSVGTAATSRRRGWRAGANRRCGAGGGRACVGVGVDGDEGTDHAAQGERGRRDEVFGFELLVFPRNEPDR